jgi:hypothetical protein
MGNTMNEFARRLCVLFVAAGLSASVAASDAAPVPTLQTDTAVATAGFYRLIWSDAGTGLPVYELQESDDGSFSSPYTVYTGQDQASVLSGQPNGRYTYRVRAKFDDGSISDWSQPVSVTVAHHPLSRAFAFFAAGAVVFLATLGLIIVGNRRAEGE